MNYQFKSCSYDPEADAAYLVVQEGIYFISEEINDNIIFDFDKSHSLLGIEILNAKEEFKKHPEFFTYSGGSPYPNEIISPSTFSKLTQTYYFLSPQITDSPRVNII